MICTPYSYTQSLTIPAEVKCGSLPAIDNGDSVCNGTDLSDVCSVACNHGYTIEGGDTYTCSDSLTWMNTGGCYNIPSTTTSTTTTTAKPTGTTTTRKGPTVTSTSTTTTITLWTCPFPVCYGWLAAKYTKYMLMQFCRYQRMPWQPMQYIDVVLR